MSEIQRLKQEAKRFIAILSQESDDETLSPTKRQSLTREVESLQVNLLCRKALLICSGRRLSTSVFEMDQSRSHGAGQFFLLDFSGETNGSVSFVCVFVVAACG